MEISVEINKLRKEFDDFTAVDSITFSARQGEVLGFLGPNGAGKSTTMKMITGFLTPSSGSIYVAGHNVLTDPIAAKRQLGYLPEGAPAYPDMTAKQFLSFIAEIRGFRGNEKKQRVDEAVEKIHLQQVLQQPIETLSKGYKRRLGLAQAILHDPNVLILDEPTDGLDPNQKHEVRELIKTMSTDKVIILSTHILEEVDAVCSRAVIIAGGKIVADATPQELESRAPSYNAVTISVQKPIAAEAQSKLNTLPALKDLEILQENEESIVFRATPEAGQSLLQPISAMTQEKQWPIEQLSVNQGRLDEYFRAVTEDKQQRN